VISTGWESARFKSGAGPEIGSGALSGRQVELTKHYQIITVGSQELTLGAAERLLLSAEFEVEDGLDQLVRSGLDPIRFPRLSGIRVLAHRNPPQPGCDVAVTQSLDCTRVTGIRYVIGRPPRFSLARAATLSGQPPRKQRGPL